MSENPIEPQGRIGIQLDKEKYTIAPSGNTKVKVRLSNHGLEDDGFALAIGGIPSSWVSTSESMVGLASGEEKETELVFQAPALGEVELGDATVIVRATSQKYPDQFAEVEMVLVIEKESVPPRISLELESAQFSVAAGSSTTFNLILKNNGLIREVLQLSIEGIPMGWVSTPSPITKIEPGESKEIPVSISPPRSPESRAGRHPITFQLTSTETPDQEVSQDAILTIAAFTAFKSEMLPASPLEALQTAQVKVTNEGNISESFKIDWQNEADLLAFELRRKDGDEDIFEEITEHVLKVEPGKQETVQFRTGLRKRPIIGGNKAYPFQVNVQASKEDSNTHNSEVTDKGLIPIWAIPIVLVLCISLACVGVYFFNRGQDTSPPVATDDSWARVQEAGVLRVATAADYPPFSYHNQDYVIDGFDPALIRDIGTKLGVQVAIEDYAFEGLGAALKVGQADVAIAAISITPERETQFGFSNIYYVGQDGLLARSNSDIGNITNPGQMSGMRVGVQKFSVYNTWAQDVLVDGGIIAQDQLFTYAKPEHAIDDLKHQRIDLVMMDLQPATLALSDGDLKLAGQGLNQQRLAIALPQGSTALQAKINEALLALQNQGRVNQLAETYLGLKPEDIIPPPTPEPTPETTATPLPTATEAACVDAMEFIEDLSYDDEDLTNFPKVDPGEAFQKGWRIKNSGNCSWDGSIYIKYTHGSDPAAQMGGQPTSIKGEVKPGETYDMYVDLVAPGVPGKYVGYWQMHNAESKAFGQTIWVAVQVRNLNPEEPTPTVTPEASATPTVPPPPTATEVPPEPTATEIPPEPTETEIPPEPTPTEEPGADLRDTTWVLEGILADLEDEDLTEPIEDVDVELIFKEEGDLEGKAGCNTFTGRYVTDGVEIVFRDLQVTRLICDQPEGIMEQEAIFLQWLERLEEYRINEDQQLEFILEVIEDNEPVDKIILIFYDLRVEPR